MISVQSLLGSSDSKTIRSFIEIMKKDKEYRRAFSDNIAMAYKDNYAWHKTKTGKAVMSQQDLHEIANNAADYFMKLLCDELEVPAGR